MTQKSCESQAYQMTADHIFTCQKTKMNDHLDSIGVT